MKFGLQTVPMRRKRTFSYLETASQQFLEGLPYRSPIEAVEAGERSLTEWCECLNRSRSLFGLHHDPLLEPDLTRWRQPQEA